MSTKERHKIRAIIKNKLQQVIDYFVPDKTDPNDIYGLKQKDCEHLIYDIKNSKINILSSRERMLEVEAFLSLEKTRLNYNAEKCSALFQDNSSLFKSTAEEYENRTRQKGHGGALTLTQKEQNYLQYKRSLDSRLQSLENTEKNIDKYLEQLQNCKESYEEQKNRYLAIMDELSLRGINITYYQKEYENITSNIFVHPRNALIKSRTFKYKQEAREQEISK